MGRFYQTTQPDYSKDFVYQPPWELMLKAAEYKQGKYDTAMAETGVFDDLLKIKHRDDEIENENVQATKDFYESEVEDITNELRTKGPSGKITRRMKQLQKNIEADREGGNIAKFENNYAMYNQHLEALKAAEKSGEDIEGARARFSKYDDKWKGQENRSIDSIMGYEELIKRPDLLDAKNIIALVKQVPAYENESIVEGLNGMYIVGTGNKTREVTAQDLLQTAMPALMSDPSLLHWAKQRQSLGLGEYFDEDGGFITPAFNNYYDKDGNPVEEDEYDNLPAKERFTQFGFADNEIGQSLRLASSMAYRETKNTYKIRPNDIKRDELKRAQKKEDEKPIQLDTFMQRENVSELNLFSTANFKDAASKAKFENNYDNFINSLPASSKPNYEGLKEKIKSGEVSTEEQANAYVFKKAYPTEQDYLEANGVTFNTDGTVKKVKSKEGSKNPTDPGVEASTVSGVNTLKHMKDNYESYSKGDTTWYQADIGEIGEGQLDETTAFGPSYKKYVLANYDGATVIASGTTMIGYDDEDTIAGQLSKTNLMTVQNNPDLFNIISVDGKNQAKQIDKDVKDTYLANLKYIAGYNGVSGMATMSMTGEDADGKRFIIEPVGRSNPAQMNIIKNVTPHLSNGRLADAYGDQIKSNFLMQLNNFRTSDENVAAADKQLPMKDPTYGTNVYIKPIPNGQGEAVYTVHTYNPKFGTYTPIEGKVTSMDEDTLVRFVQDRAAKAEKNKK